MNHPILDAHDAIAWDMDGTLVNGPNSDFFRDYIMAHPEKQHHVVTFRDETWANRAHAELERYGLTHAVSLIISIQSCPQDWLVFWEGQHNTFKKQKLLRNYTQEDIDAGCHSFQRFKGRKAFELGCTILVDDLPSWVMAGCNENGIAFLHAHQPI